MTKAITLIDSLVQTASRAGEGVGLLGLRVLLAYEFWEAGVMKFNGANWFGDIQEQFPFPFNVVPHELSWFLATWTELLGAVGLVLGLTTRFWSIGLAMLTVVAWVSVHAGNGYNVCDSGFKLPLMYLIMLVPLILYGPGKLSLDAWIWRKIKGSK